MPTAYDTVILNDSPNGYWPLSDANGSGTAADLTAGAHNGTATSVTFGSSGGCIDGSTSASFNGSSSVVGTFGFAPVSAYSITIEFALKANSLTPIGIWDSGPGQANCTRNYPAGWVQHQTGSLAQHMNIPDTTGWHLYQVEFYISGANINLDTWLDGVKLNNLDSQTTLAANVPFNWATSWVIGNINGGANGWYSGSLQKFAVYPVALSQSQITAHYTAYTTSTTNTNLSVAYNQDDNTF